VARDDQILPGPFGLMCQHDDSNNATNAANKSRTQNGSQHIPIDIGQYQPIVVGQPEKSLLDSRKITEANSFSFRGKASRLSDSRLAPDGRLMRV
jgi:hypothetical protein